MSCKTSGELLANLESKVAMTKTDRTAVNKLIARLHEMEPEERVKFLEQAQEDYYGAVADIYEDGLAEDNSASFVMGVNKNPKWAHLNSSPIKVLSIKPLESGMYIVRYTNKSSSVVYSAKVDINGKFVNDPSKEFGFGLLDYTATVLGSSPAANAANLAYKNLGKTVHRSTEKMLELATALRSLDKDTISDEYFSYATAVIQNIDPMLLPKINVLINTKAAKMGGTVNLDTKTMKLAVSNKPKTAGNQMSAVEMYLHELIHAFTGFAVESKFAATEARPIIRKIEHLKRLAREHVKIEDFLPDVSLDAVEELKHATNTYNYIFNNSKTGLHEFIAHSLSNPKLMEKLKVVTVNDKELQVEPMSLLDTIIKYASNLVNIVLGKYTFGSMEHTVFDELTALTFNLAEYNNKALKRRKDPTSLSEKIYSLIDVGNKKGEIIQVKLEQFFDQMKVAPLPKNATKLETAMWLARYLPKLIGDSKMRPFLNLVLSTLGMKPEAFLQNVIRDVSTPDDLERMIEQLGLDSDKIDNVRETIAVSAKESIMKQFKTKLSRAELNTLTLIGLDTDMSSIFDSYTPAEIQTLLTDDAELSKAIHSATTEIAHKDRANLQWYTNQANGLGYYMATHKAGIAQNLNAHNIASLNFTRKKVGRPDKALVASIDKLATLYAIKYSPKQAKEVFSDLFKREPEGIAHFMSFHTGFKNESAKELFKNKVLMIKGYSKEIFDDSVSIVIKPVAMAEEMNNDGYELIEELPKAAGDTSKHVMGVYRSKRFVSQNYNRAATRITNLAKRGTTLTAARFKGNEAMAAKQAQLDIQKMNIAQRAIVDQMQLGVYDPKQDMGLVPVLNDSGKVVDYRYIMSKSRKRVLLEQDIDGAQVLSRMFASNYDKMNTKEQNDNVLAVIEADMKDNYIPGETLGRNNAEYIRISPTSPIEKVAELYKILPDNMKQAIANSDNGYIAVRRDMLHNYFGFRNMSIMDTMFGGLLPKEWHIAFKFVEKLWQEIISITKVDIVIRTPAVFIGNVISNLMYSIQTGNSPIKVLKRTLDNARNIREYINIEKEIATLELAKKSGNYAGMDIKKIASLKESLSRNPLHPLMKTGMYQAIIEDVSMSDFKSNNRVSQWIDKKTEGVPEFVRNGAHWLYLSERTSFFRYMTQATQYSDLAARATEYQFLLEKGIPEEQARITVLDAFINYNKPSTALEQWANDMGLVMFTKYFKRIQRVIKNGITKHPVSFILSLLAQEGLMDISDVTDSSLMSKNYGAISQNMVDELVRAVTPSLAEAAYATVKKVS